MHFINHKTKQKRIINIILKDLVTAPSVFCETINCNFPVRSWQKIFINKQGQMYFTIMHRCFPVKIYLSSLMKKGRSRKEMHVEVLLCLAIGDLKERL